MSWLDELARDGHAGQLHFAGVPPAPPVVTVQLPPMPRAGDQDLMLLRTAFGHAFRQMGMRFPRVPHPDQWPAATIAAVVRADEALGKHEIPPYGWALFRVQGLRMYDVPISLRVVWDPAKIEKQRGHYVRWAVCIPRKRTSTACLALLDTYQRALEELAGTADRGALQTRTIMCRHFPLGYDKALRLMHAASLTEEHDLRVRAAQGEWVW